MMDKIEKIYFDMDGVLADFDRGVSELCGLTPLSQNSPHRSPAADDAMWAKIREIDHFYDRLALMPGAKDMFDTVFDRYGDKCEILTGIPKPRRGILHAGEDKTNWVHRLLSDRIRVNIVLREEKPLYCTGKGCILIDDHSGNIADWIAAGGTGILHTGAVQTLTELSRLAQ